MRNQTESNKHRDLHKEDHHRRKTNAINSLRVKINVEEPNRSEFIDAFTEDFHYLSACSAQMDCDCDRACERECDCYSESEGFDKEAIPLISYKNNCVESLCSWIGEQDVVVGAEMSLFEVHVLEALRDICNCILVVSEEEWMHNPLGKEEQLKQKT